MIKIGSILRQLRSSKKITQDYLGKQLNLSASTIGMYEQDRRLPDIDTLINICNYFNVSSNYVLGISDDSTRFQDSQSNITISDRIKFLMDNLNYSLHDLSSFSGIRIQRLTDILSGTKPSIDEVAELSEALYVSTDYILCMTDFYEKLTFKNTWDIDRTPFENHLGRLVDGDSKAEICSCLDIPKYLLNAWINGETMPDSSNLVKLAKYFNVSTDYLLGLTEKTREIMDEVDYPFLFSNEQASKISQLLNKEELPDDLGSFVMGISDEEFSNFKNYGFIPHVAPLINLAKRLRCSIDYLLSQNLESTEKIVNIFTSLSDEYKDRAIGELRRLQHEQEIEAYKKRIAAPSVAADDTPEYREAK